MAGGTGTEAAQQTCAAARSSVVMREKR